MELMSDYSMEPTQSFNQSGAHSLFTEIFRVLLGTACKLFKLQEKYLDMCRVLTLDDMIKQQRKEQTKLLKSIVDEIISHFAYIIKDFRYYDQYLLIESDAWTVQKICKLSIMDRTYFQIFKEQLT